MKDLAAVVVALALGTVVLASPLPGPVARIPQAPSLDDLLKRAGESVVRYEQQAALVLADERCEQKGFEAVQEKSNSPYSYSGTATRVDPTGHRKWQADLALVRTQQLASSGSPWMEFRDVIETDGRPVAGGQHRLSRLFVEEPEWSLDRARQIADESARFNIGGLRRVVTTPSMPLLVLHPLNLSRFSFQKVGEEVVEKTRAWKIEYRELRAPTLISSDHDFCPASGALWVDPKTGEVVRALLQCVPAQAPDSVDAITVTYRVDPKLGTRLPVEMLERPEGVSSKTSWAGPNRAWVEGKCTYSNYRRFETAAKMIPVK